MRTRELNKLMGRLNRAANLTAAYQTDLLMADVESLLSGYRGKTQDIMVERVNDILGYENLEQQRRAIAALSQPAVSEKASQVKSRGVRHLEDFLTRASMIAFDSGDAATVKVFAEGYSGPYARQHLD